MPCRKQLIVPPTFWRVYGSGGGGWRLWGVEYWIPKRGTCLTKIKLEIPHFDTIVVVCLVNWFYFASTISLLISHCYSLMVVFNAKQVRQYHILTGFNARHVFILVFSLFLFFFLLLCFVLFCFFFVFVSSKSMTF